MVRYGYGLSIIESIDIDTNKPYAIRFYQALHPSMVGVHQSHGYTYANARKYYKEGCKKPLGLELLLENKGR